MAKDLRKLHAFDIKPYRDQDPSLRLVDDTRAREADIYNTLETALEVHGRSNDILDLTMVGDYDDDGI